MAQERVFVDRTEREHNGAWFVYENIIMKCAKCHMLTAEIVTGPNEMIFGHSVGTDAAGMDVMKWHVVPMESLPIDDMLFWRFLFHDGKEATR